MCPPPPGKPYINYKDGDFVTFMVVESPADFKHVIANYPRDVKLLHPFSPKLPMAPVAEDDTRVLLFLAFQDTVFQTPAFALGLITAMCVVMGKRSCIS
ncbi:hypothetical protein CRYUN_Cryun18bG0090100 [Craigia yunnanensis]